MPRWRSGWRDVLLDYSFYFESFCVISFYSRFVIISFIHEFHDAGRAIIATDTGIVKA